MLIVIYEFSMPSIFKITRDNLEVEYQRPFEHSPNQHWEEWLLGKNSLFVQVLQLQGNQPHWAITTASETANH